MRPVRQFTIVIAAVVSVVLTTGVQSDSRRVSQRTSFDVIVPRETVTVAERHASAPPVYSAELEGARRLAAPVLRTEGNISSTYGELPLVFEKNEGQFDSRIQFVSRGAGYAFALAPTEAIMALSGKQSGQAMRSAVRMTLVGACDGVAARGEERLATSINYLVGRDRNSWHANVPAFAKVHYREVYPGTDLIYYGHQGELEYDFILSPGADPAAVALRFDGHDGLHIDDAGNLSLATEVGEMRQRKPVVYQIFDGRRVSVSGRFRLLSESTIGFEIGEYDRSRELIIDPAVTYASRLSNAVREVNALAVDAAGGLYIGGVADSPGLPVINALLVSHHSAANWNWDGFLMKLSPDGRSIEFCTYLGGTFDDVVRDVSVDAGSNVYLVGRTESPDFPATLDGFQPKPLHDEFTYAAGFLMKFNPAHQLVYSTFIGKDIYRLKVSSDGSPHVVGEGFPLTKKGHNEPVALCVAKVQPDASALIYSVTIPGTYVSTGNAGIALDGFGNAYVVGSTFIENFPTLSPAQSSCSLNLHGECRDGFAMKLDANGDAVYSTYLGGSEDDEPYDAAVDSSGNLYLTGRTDSIDFPVVSALQPVTGDEPYGGGILRWDAFVTKLSASGNQIVYSTYLGGMEFDAGLAIRVDNTGRAFVFGRGSPDMPLQDSFLSQDFGSAFLTVLSTSGGLAEFSTILPMGAPLEDAIPLAMNGTGSEVYLGGFTFRGVKSRTPLENPAFKEGGTSVIKLNMTQVRPTLTPVLVRPGVGPTVGGDGFVICDAFEGIDEEANPSATFSVIFGGTPATGVVYSSPGCISGNTPAHAAGVVDITVSASYGKSGVIRKAYRYSSSDFDVTSITPGSVNGSGTAAAEIVISGTGFTQQTDVAFTESPPGIGDLFVHGIRYVSESELRVIAKEAVGSYDVTVTPEAGGNPAVWEQITVPSAVTFTAPAVIEYDPIDGPSSGNTAIRFSGIGLGNPIQVTFDGVPGAVGSCLNCSPMTITTPAHAPGPVDIVYVTSAGSHTIPGGFTYRAERPTFSSALPNQGPQVGGTSVTISGSNFQTGARVLFGGVLSPSVNVVNTSTIVAVTPPHHGGPVAIRITQPDGQFATSGTSGYTYTGPSISGIGPRSGSQAGGTSVLISFASSINTPTSGATVTFGGTPATITSYNSFSLSVQTPPHAIGTVDVVVTSSDGQSDRRVRGFTYLGPGPTLTSVSPPSGPSAGGTSLTLTGTDFVNGSRVFINSSPVPVTFNSSTSLTVVTAPQSAGSKTVTVLNPDNQKFDLSNGFTYVAAPAISTLTPATGPEGGGTSVIIAGSSFDPSVQVTFGGVPAAALTWNSTQQLTAVTPAHVAADVDVVATNADGQIATKTNGFRYLPPAPTITNFTPTTDFPGANVTITGTNFLFVNSVTFFNGKPAVFTVDSPTQISAVVPNLAVTGPISVTTAAGTATSGANFVVQNAGAQIDSFNPTTGGGGISVVITGSRMGGATAVRFGGVPAASFTVVGTTQVNAVTPANGITGPICMTTPGPFEGCSATDFTFPPRVTGFAPPQGLPETAVTINGANFQGATGVSFNGAAATPFTLVNATTITTTVPAGATTGPVTVTTPAGSGISATLFGVPPEISGFTPTRGGPGGTITITGVRFTGATAVRFNGTNAMSFTVGSDVSITAQVPTGATAGPISVTTPGGTAQSTASFEIAATPTITAFTPNKGTAGTSVAITGTNFATVTSVTFNGRSASFSINGPTSITGIVPGSATSGPITMTNDEGPGSSAALFYLPAVVSSFSPNAGSAGSTVTIFGNNFTGATAVAFNGAGGTFTINAPDRITATVPAGATSGVLSVTTPYGVASSAFSFTILSNGTPIVTATAVAPSSVVLTWSGLAGSTYQIRRIVKKSDNFGTSAIATVTGNMFVDNTVAAGVTYLYNVLNVTTGQIGNNDYATTIMFADNPVALGTPIKAQHLTELRSAVNAMRVSADLPVASWTDAAVPGLAVKTQHVTELRTALNAALIALGRYASFTDSELTSGMFVRAAHFQEVREAVK